MTKSCGTGVRTGTQINGMERSSEARANPRVYSPLVFDKVSSNPLGEDHFYNKWNRTAGPPRARE